MSIRILVSYDVIINRPWISQRLHVTVHFHRIVIVQ